jgi:hypothetical protein
METEHAGFYWNIFTAKILLFYEQFFYEWRLKMSSRPRTSYYSNHQPYTGYQVVTKTDLTSIHKRTYIRPVKH